MKTRILAILTCITVLFTATLTVKADGTGEDVNAYGQAYLVFGADLSSDQFKTVCDLLEVSEDDLADFVQLEVTNKEEHEYLDAYLESSVIGSHAYSSLKMIPQAEGSGLNIETHNINYCTVAMYQNALITAGVSDAYVVIAGPFDISGTAALIGTVKAYADSQGEDLNEDALEAATNEIVLTGEIGEELGNTEDVAELIAYVKQKVVEEGLESDEEIKAVVLEGAKTIGLELTDSQVDQVVALMKKISKLDIDPEALAKQATDIYNKLKDMGIDLGSMDKEGLLAFIQKFIQQILDFLTGLFS